MDRIYEKNIAEENDVNQGSLSEDPYQLFGHAVDSGKGSGSILSTSCQMLQHKTVLNREFEYFMLRR